eukprot:jgi/Bigna1/85621/estExt_fgenesh1_pg.C_50067
MVAANLHFKVLVALLCLTYHGAFGVYRAPTRTRCSSTNSHILTRRTQLRRTVLPMKTLHEIKLILVPSMNHIASCWDWNAICSGNLCGRLSGFWIFDLTVEQRQQQQQQQKLDP